jgi:hypothetical protein
VVLRRRDLPSPSQQKSTSIPNTKAEEGDVAGAVEAGEAGAAITMVAPPDKTSIRSAQTNIRPLHQISRNCRLRPLKL